MDAKQSEGQQHLLRILPKVSCDVYTAGASSLCVDKQSACLLPFCDLDYSKQLVCAPAVAVQSDVTTRSVRHMHIVALTKMMIVRALGCRNQLRNCWPNCFSGERNISSSLRRKVQYSQHGDGHSLPGPHQTRT
jgi:hypothetical protein